MPRAPGRPLLRLLSSLLVAFSMGACTHAFRPFTARAITWRDPDTEGWGPRPPARDGGAVWDATDGLFFRPQVRALSVPRPRESVDVNALDEVPDSSWFVNRIGVTSMTPREVARGACASVDEEPRRPWRVADVKPDGVQPGFVIEDRDGRRWLLKTDAAGEPERATAADVVVAALLHAAGYHVPCNRVVFFTPADLRVEPGRVPDGDLRRVIEAASRHSDGRLRASVSAYVPGRPLGPWSYTGVWEADENDRVPHELRRELRALRLFAAWVDHVDARAQNTLSYWVGSERAGHVRHALIDFGDAFGASHPDPRRTARYGYTAWIDPTAAIEDLVTLGLVPRPWHREVTAGSTLGDFATEPFDPDAWRANYENGAFEQADETDLAWAARILARVEPAHLRAAAALARFADPRTTERLVSALTSRRRAILEAHLSRRAPLARPRLEGRRLCLEDVAVAARIRSDAARVDTARARWRDGGDALVRPTRDGAEVCVTLPPPRDGYLVMDVRAETPGADAPGPARLHLAARRGGYRLLGLERPPRGETLP